MPSAEEHLRIIVGDTEAHFMWSLAQAYAERDKAVAELQAVQKRLQDVEVQLRAYEETVR